MAWGKAYWVTLTSILALLVSVISGSDASQHCKFPATYNFGDSNSDTGGISAALGEIPLPYGETYFHRPSGRAGDGRLVIDFIAEDLRLPYLSAYLDSINANFKHGANFATGGSSIRPGGYSPFHLGIQISQFMQFKSRTSAIYSQQSSRGKFGLSKSHLPRPRDFSKALYTMDIGQNDLAYGFQYTNEQEVLASIPDIIDQFTNATQQLYNEGARAFWIHNTGPLGCLPSILLPYEPKSGNLDHTGCVEPINRAAREFNQQLEKRVSKLRLELPDASFTYVDMYSAKYALISHAKGQAIYNFGDSNSDTGGISAALGEIPLPYGETYFHRPSGRASDGRLLIDFIAEDLRLPYLSAYLDSINANFRHGANFATGGSSIRPGGYSPFHLRIQISEFIQFKSRTNAIYSQQTGGRVLPNPSEVP